MTMQQGYRIHALELGPMDNILYLIEDVASRKAAMVDPAWEISRVLELAESQGLEITHVLLTHSHGDHINGIQQVLERISPQIHLLRREAEFWGQAPEDARLHEDGDVIELGQTRIRIIHTPGHTPGSACFHLGNDLIVGDTLFVYGCGRCDLKGGDPEAMYWSLKRLSEELSPETVIHPGHDYGIEPTSTIGDQMRGNPFMQFRDPARFIHYRMVEHDRVRSGPYGPEHIDQGR